jgi:hypothetical protein
MMETIGTKSHKGASVQVGCEKDIAQAPRCHAVCCDAFRDIEFFFTTLHPSLFRLLTLFALPSFLQPFHGRKYFVLS